MITLRSYQVDLLDRIRAAFAAHRRVLAVSPTGSGKTVMFGWLTQQVAQRGKRVVIVAHRIEIVEQISAALTAFGVSHSLIVSGRPLSDQPVQVAMVQTLARRIDRVVEPDMVVIDEAHHAVAGTWRTVADRWRDALVLGVTATPERLDGRGLRDAFDVLVPGPTVRDLIDAGHLAPFRHYSSASALDTSGIRTVAGDYDAGQVADALVRQRIVGCAVEEYRRLANGGTAVAFCPTVAFADVVARDFQAAGIPAARIDGGMAAAERAATVDALRSGVLRVIASCDLISEGFDLPAIGAAILLRPTRSLALYMQQVGRALRPKPDGAPAIIIDHVGNGLRHGLVDFPRAWSLDGKKSRARDDMRIKQCPVCYRVVAAAGVPQDCAETSCGLASDRTAQGGARDDIERVAGVLEEVTGAALPDWAGGMHIARAPLRQVLRLARTRDQLEAVRRARGYKPGWVHHVLRERAARQGGVP